jgi:exopolysaccharide biosynthesis polyprenyl glycosylphosphotransferase
MVRIFRIYYPVRTLALLGGDALVLILSFVIAVMLQYREDSLLELQYNFGLPKILIMTLAVLLFAHYLDLYSPSELTSINEAYVRLYALLGGISIALAIIAFRWPAIVIGNNVFFYGTVFATIGLSCWRAFFNWTLSKSFMTERVYVLGEGERAQRLVNVLRKRIDMGMEVVGWSGALGSSTDPQQLGKNLLASRYRSIERVIVALEDRRGRMPMEDLIQLRLNGVIIEDAATLLEKITGRLEVSNLSSSSLVFTDGFKVSYVHQACMHLVSFAVAAVTLIVTAPLLLLVAMLIKLDSRGPALFIQRRVGENGKTFILYKFRSMVLGSAGPAPTDSNDPRFTRVGKWLRRSRLDELPQMFNVLKGDMNLVGPRPFIPSEEQECVANIPFYSLRWHVKPGITGWAQIRRGYNSTIEDNTEKLAYDLFYIKNASLSLDLMIMFETAKILFLRRGSR